MIENRDDKTKRARKLKRLNVETLKIQRLEKTKM